ncbi:class I SAM-dependent methyltransferase [Thalassoroseus pseudoceratinae]|uniref:class I SAM-dependent methyltransferase n=1 Tax=Thalassoroseus pseudoceratinae TaxID=2713176 RepID=UPI00141E7290|nr:SAM-dependent methyltransferase [Thalassoroseus pseudoceratinae]
MTAPNSDPETFAGHLENAVQAGTLISAVLSRPKNRQESARKITVSPLKIRGELLYQFAHRYDREETHENVTAEAVSERLQELIGTRYRDCHLMTTTADYQLRLNKKGHAKLSQSPPSHTSSLVTDHNRRKQHLIPDGEPCDFLAAIGVMTAEGRVKANRQRKFRQINRYLELVEHIIPSLPKDGPLNVVDFGCGKSYLTFALHHLLTKIHGRVVSIVGLDRKTAVLADCQRIASRLGLRGLRFEEGDIAAFDTNEPVHLAVSLHACDTATDDAIAQAVRWNANVILAVPCCQHELARKITPDWLAGMQQHGILQERLATLLTDSLRAKALEAVGYRTQVVEFIDMEHTAKNVLIRAVRREPTSENQQEAFREYQQLKQTAGLDEIYLDSVLDWASLSLD